MFLSKAGEYEACGLFSVEHIMLIIATIISIKIALKNTIYKSKNEIKSIIKKCVIAMWIFEVIIIVFKITKDGFGNINNYIPLYYCSLLLYAGLLSAFSNGKLKRIGDVFLATGGIVGGIVFIIFPTTSLMMYPMQHLVSIHSFVFHGIMIYLGLLINITDYIKIEKSDIKYYASLVGGVCVLAFIVNNIFGSNLMFISQNFPGMPIEILYNATGKFFTPVMCIIQMTLPFMFVYMTRKSIKAKQYALLLQENQNYSKVGG